ncbi:MAG: hypothetical protein F6K35_13350 [Okeania sp. SIO2H7]|nr:hypothetical protein [Okeania sp. SIO2H7]
MTLSEELKQILNRIEKGEQTEEDINVLPQLLRDGDRRVAIQLGKYNVNIGEGQDIHIGDRTYYDWNDKALRDLVRQIQSDAIKSKIEEKQAYCKNKIAEINYQTENRLSQLESYYQNSLMRLETDYQNNLMRLETEYRNNQNQEIDRLILNLRGQKNDLESVCVKDGFWVCNGTLYDKHRNLVNDIEALSQRNLNSLSSSTKEQIGDSFFKNAKAELDKNIARNKEILESNLSRESWTIQSNAASQIAREKEEVYRFMVKSYLDREGYPLSPQSFDELKQFQLELEMSEEEVEIIEKSESKPFYEKNIRTYKAEFQQIIDREGYPLSETTRDRLKQRQTSLGLLRFGYKYVDSVEQLIIQPFYEENMRKYREEFIELMNERVSALTQESLAKLRKKQDKLGLKNKDANNIEQLIIKQFYQTNLDKYQQEFQQIINREGHPLSNKSITRLRQRQQLLGIEILGFNNEDIEVVKGIIKHNQDEHRAIDYLSGGMFKKDYQELRDLLASNKWKEANEETITIVLNLLKNSDKSKLLHIKVVNLLWDAYSHGRFGFHKQIEIFIAADKNYKTFSENIGWKKKAFFLLDFLSWKSEDEIIFNINAPKGHLPFWRLYVSNPEQFLIKLSDVEV